MYVVTVEFVIKADAVEPFLNEMQANPAASLKNERGCTRFDVCVDPADLRRVFLYELYVDRAGFDEHLNTAHYKAFNQAIALWVDSKVVKTWHLSAH